MASPKSREPYSTAGQMAGTGRVQDRPTLKKGRRLRVLSADDFRVAIRLLVYLAGGRAAFRKSTGIDKATISRWLSGSEVASVSKATHAKLRRAISEYDTRYDTPFQFSPKLLRELRDRHLLPPDFEMAHPHWVMERYLRLAILPEEGQHRLGAFSAWVDTALCAAMGERKRYYVLTPDEIAARARAFAILKARVPLAVRQRVERIGGEQISDERTRVDRIALAWWRILGPLLEAKDSGGVERRAIDVSDRELQTFVKHGVEREVWLFQNPEERVMQSLASERPRPPRRSHSRST